MTASRRPVKEGYAFATNVCGVKNVKDQNGVYMTIGGTAEMY